MEKRVRLSISDERRTSTKSNEEARFVCRTIKKSVALVEIHSNNFQMFSKVVDTMPHEPGLN